MRTKTKRLLLTLTAVALLTAAVAVDYRFYDNDRLSCSLVKTMCQDADGFIWIGTEYGLNRFDGHKFRQYTHDDAQQESLASDNVSCLYVDRDKRLWVGTSAGLQLYDKAGDCFLRIPFDGISGTGVNQVLEMADGSVTVRTTGRGLYRFDPKRRMLIKVETPKRPCGKYSVASIFEDRLARTWYSTSAGEVFCVDKAARRTISITPQQLGGERVKLINETSGGQLVLCTDMHVYLFNERMGSVTAVRNANGDTQIPDIRSLCKTADGRLLVLCYTDGVLLLDDKTATVRSYTDLSSLSVRHGAANYVALIEDSDRNLWIGQTRLGVLMIPHSKSALGFNDFASASRPFGIGAVNALTSDDGGTIYIGTLGGHIYTCDGNGAITTDNTVRSAAYALCPADGGDVLVGTYSNGIAQLNPHSGAATYLPQLEGKRVSALTRGHDGTFYMAVYGENIYAFRGSPASDNPIDRKVNDRFGMKDHHINKLFADSRGRIWAGTYKGVDIYDPQTGTFLKEQSLDSISSVACYAIAEDSHGTIYMGTQSGLYAWHPATKSLRRYSTTNGLSNNTVCGIAIADNGDVWVSTFNGIAMLNATTGRVSCYGGASPSADKEFSRGAYCSLSQGGTVCFGGLHGLTYFKPSSMRQHPLDRQVKITGMTVGGRSVNASTRSGGSVITQKPLPETSDIKLSHDDNTFTLEFSTMDYAVAEMLRYEFRIVENDSSWTALGRGVNSVTFSHIAHGTYTLEVRANLNGQLSPVSQFKLHIAAPWYLSWYALLLYLLAAVLVGYLIYNNVRHRYSIEENERRTRFFINIAHDIRSPLTLIISPLEALLRGNHDADTMRLLRTMYRNSQRIMSMMNEMLDIRRIDKGQLRLQCEQTNMVALLEGIVDTFRDLAVRHRIELSLEHDGDVTAVVDRNQMDKVVVNLVDNAFKFTPDGGKITLRLSYQTEPSGKHHEPQKYAVIAVEDNGKGIDEGEVERLFDRFYQGKSDGLQSAGFGIGLNLCRLIVMKHHGTITAKRVSQAGGSVFTVMIPVNTETNNTPVGAGFIRPDQTTSQPQDLTTSRPHNLTTSRPSHNFLLSEPTEEERRHRKAVAPSKRYRILVVDDDDDIRDFLTTELSDTYRVSACSNGEEALRMAVSQLPDVVVTDIMMPVMDGNTLLHRLKTNTTTSHIPVIMLTTKSERTDRLASLESGADAYIAKPFVLSELSVLIQNLINQRSLLKGKYSGTQEQAGNIENIEVSGNDEQLMERITRSVNAHISEPDFTVEALAADVGLSRVQLHRRMKELTGMTTSDFIRNIRIKQAARLLAENKINVSQVAYSVGFANRAHFSTLFRKFYGMSPQEYTKRASSEGGVTKTNTNETNDE